MNYVSIFSGIEAATVAFEQLGWTPIAFSEIEPFACQLLQQRFPDVPNLGDITQIDWKEVKDKYGEVDMVVGGSPCQSFSIAGSHKGLAGASGLMYEYIRCVRELRPTWFLWENVPGALSSDKGEAFRQFLEAMDERGYGMAWRVLDSQWYGLAQRRKRLYVVGCAANPAAAAAVLFEPENVRRTTQPSREAW